MGGMGKRHDQNVKSGSWKDRVVHETVSLRWLMCEAADVWSGLNCYQMLFHIYQI